MTVLLTRRAVLQAKNEASYNVAETLGTSDGLLVQDPQYTADATVLERNFTRNTLSPQASIVGRMLAKMEFTTELRGNGKQNSGIESDAPLITRLFRGAGYDMIGSEDGRSLGPFDAGSHANPVSWAVTSTDGDLTNTDVIAYYLTVDTGGASGTAKITVTSDTAGEGTASAIVTSGTEKDIGTKGLAITPTFTGNLVVGQRWTVWVLPPGILLKPRSEGFESVTLAMYKDGIKHLMPGGFGTFQIDATAGQFPTVKWTFTGTYNDAADVAMPSPIYEKTLPNQVELARLRTDNFSAIVEKFTFDQGNDIQVRPDVNSAQGYIGTRIVAKKPVGGINPEADTVANYDFWGKMRNATTMPFQMRCGKTAGNIVWVIAPNTQYTGMTYTDRNGILTFDAGLAFSGYQEDDEAFFFFH